MPQSDPQAALDGQPLLDAVTDIVVSLHVRYYHRAPTSARTQLLGDDLLACTLTGVYTDVEKTLIEVRGPSEVHDARRTFQETIRSRYVAAVERLSGREVRSFVSSLHVGPDMAVELFVLGPPRAA